MYLSEDFYDRWQHIIDNVDKTNVPVECIDRIVIKLNGIYGFKQKTINIGTLKLNGLEPEEIEAVIARALNDLQDDIKKVDFFLDLEAVADIVQPETEHFLKNL
jgi:hypothetical protein